MGGLTIEVLGPIQARRNDAVMPVRAARLRTLVAALLVDGPRPVPSSVLMERIYDADVPASGVATLHVFVNRLRQLFEPHRHPKHDWSSIVNEGDGYRIGVEPDAVDRWRYATLVRLAGDRLHQQPATALELLGEADHLWRGAPWGGLAGRDWLDADITTVEELRASALELQAEALLLVQQLEEAVILLQGGTSEQPFRERRWELLMTALYRAGRQEEALAAFDRIRHLLIEELGVEPGPALQRLRSAILDQDDSLMAGPAPALVVHPLPRGVPHPLTELIGREAERPAIAAALRRSRLVTLTGPGGAGKTRLAIDAALAASTRFGQTCFVDLDRSGGRSVGAELADALRLSSPDTDDLDGVVDALRDRQLLVVMDNCEHVVDEVATVVDRLLSTCPDVTVLATSRLALDLHGEVQIRVALLPTPADEPTDDVAANPAVRLFLDRAAEVAPIDEDDAAALALVAELVDRLDGLPLAIELAAARLRVLDLQQLVDGLGDRITLLRSTQRERPDRQRALTASLDISYDLLAPQDRAWLLRLAVLPAGFTVDLLRSRDDPTGVNATELVDRLVASSLVTAGGGTPPLFRLLETTRADALARLRDAGDEDCAHASMVEHVTHYAEWARDALPGPHQRLVLDQLDRLYPNFVHLLQWSVDAGRHDEARRLAVALDRYWFLRRHWGDGPAWLARVDRPGLAEDDPVAHARLLLAQLLCDRSQDRLGVERRPVLSAITDTFREHGDVETFLEAAGLLAVSSGGSGDLAAMDALIAEARPVVERMGSEWHRLALGALEAMRIGLSGDLAGGRRALHDAATSLADHGDIAFASRLSFYAANLAHFVGDTDTARAELHRSLAYSDLVEGGGAESEALQLLIELDRHDDGDTAAARLQSAHDLAVARGERLSAARCLRDLAELDLRQGDVEHGAERYRRALPVLAQLRPIDLGIAAIQLARAVPGDPELQRCLRDGAVALFRTNPYGGAERVRLRDELDADDIPIPDGSAEIVVDGRLVPSPDPHPDVDPATAEGSTVTLVEKVLTLCERAVDQLAP